MKTLWRSCLILLCVGLSSPIWAQSFFDISTIGTSAKMVGMGNIEGFDGSAAAIFENPASLYPVQNFSFAAFTSNFLGSIQYSNIAMAFNESYGTFGVGVIQARSDNIEGTVKNDLGEVSTAYLFGYSNTLVKLGAEFPLAPHVYGGLSLNYYHLELDSILGNGGNIDAGIYYEGRPVQLSFAVKNLIPSKMYYNDGSRESLPIQPSLSGKWSAFSDLDLFGQLKYENINRELLKSVGIKYQPLSSHKLMYVSVGARELNSTVGKKTNVEVGLGLELQIINIYFAYDKSDFYQQDNKFYLSTSINL